MDKKVLVGFSKNYTAKLLNFLRIKADHYIETIKYCAPKMIT